MKFLAWVEKVTGHTLAELPVAFHGYLHTAFATGVDMATAREHHARERQSCRVYPVTHTTHHTPRNGRDSGMKPERKFRTAAAALTGKSYTALIWWLEGDHQTERVDSGLWTYYGEPIAVEWVLADLERVYQLAVWLESNAPLGEPQSVPATVDAEGVTP